jgi:subtilisin family serine protease
MPDSTISLRRGPDPVSRYALVESQERFVVHFRTTVPGGSAAKALLRLPLMFGRRVHPRKLPVPPRLALFEVRPDQAAQNVPGYGDDTAAIRDGAMNFIRSTAGKTGSTVVACYHTYQRGEGDGGGAGNRDNELFPSGQLFLEFNAAVPEPEQRRLLDHYKLLVDRAILYWPGAFVVSVTKETGASPVRLAAELQALRYRRGRAGDALVFDYADPLFHRRREYAALPNDSLFQYQWHLRNDGSGGGVAGADIAATEAWDYTLGDPSVRVAVIDDGFDLHHPDIEVGDRIEAPLDAMSGSTDPSPTEGADEWHGTSVLGLIAAAHNGRGASGVAPRCHIIPIKLEALSDDEAEARAFDHAVASGAAVINCSWGPYDDYSRDPWPMPRIVELAIDNAYRNDVAVVFAAGNGNEEIATDGYANHPHVITVAASTDCNTRAYYSDYGAAVWVCAPSSGGRSGVVTTDVEEGGENPFGSYSSGFGGTSSAAPLVSGVIALMQSAFVRQHGPGHRLSVDQVKKILRDTATKIDRDGKPFREYWEGKPIDVRYDARGHSVAYGYGLVNAGRAVRRAAAMRRRPASRVPTGARIGAAGFAAGSMKLGARLVGDPLALFNGDARTKLARPATTKFESGEHVWLGDRGFARAFEDAALANKIQLTDYRMIARQDRTVTFRYGELVALSGDFYRSPADLYWEKPGAIPWVWEDNDLRDIREAFAKELQAIREQQQDPEVRYPDNNIAYWWNAKAYIELALDNTDHFGWHNLRAYCRHHGQALEFARQARQTLTADPDKAAELLGQAIFTNAFADHFLTDGFAAGHVRVPRAEIRQWATGRGYSEKLAGALSKLLHDQDGHIDGFHGEGHSLTTGPAEGLAVCNARGDRWSTRCDGQLFVVNSGPNPLLDLPVEAVRLSVTELLRAYVLGEIPEGVYAATRLVPFPDPDKPGLTDKFPASAPSARIAKLLESIKWYVKVPYLSAGVEAEHIHDLFTALPDLLASFRNTVKTHAASPDLAPRLPKALVDAFSTLK